jgi:hypothetical protein
MEEILTQAFSTGDIKIVVVAVILYVIIYFQRKDTGKKRNNDRDELITRVTLIETEIQEIKNLDLATKLAQIQTDLSWIKDKLKEK